MKKTKIVIPALAVLLLSTAASVSGTVAWFSMSTSVTVTGMSVTTKVSSNLQIAESNVEEYYSDSIQQDREGYIEPSSSTDGVGFFWTTNAKNDGDAKQDTYTAYDEDTALVNAAAGKTNYDDDFNTAYQFTGTEINSELDVSYAYIDYSFYLKGAATVEGQRIALTKCNMLYNTQAIQTSFAWRVGMFVADSNASDATAASTAVDANNLVTILDFASSKNQNQRNKAVVPADGDSLSGLYTDAACTTDASGTADDSGTTYYEKHSDDVPQAVKTASTLANVTNPDQEALVHEFISSELNQVKYYKVVVRLWLEGEDVSCTSTTFANLTRSWTLDLEFKLGKNADAQDTSFNGVENIGSVAA